MGKPYLIKASDVQKELEKIKKDAEEWQDLPPYTYYKLKCEKCGRKILVEIVLMGVNHNMAVIATCAKCLKKKGPMKGFKEQRPSEYEDIMEWIL